MKEFADDEDVKQPSTREFHNGGEDRILKVANDRLPTDFELCQLRLTLLAWSVSKIRVPNRMINSALIGTPSMRKRKEAMDNVSLCTLHKLLALPTSSNSWDGHGCRRELETDVYVSTICLDSLNIMCKDALHTIAQFSKTLNLLLKSLNVFSCLSDQSWRPISTKACNRVPNITAEAIRGQAGPNFRECHLEQLSTGAAAPRRP